MIEELKKIQDMLLVIQVLLIGIYVYQILKILVGIVYSYYNKK